MKEEPITDAFTVKPTTTDGKVTSLLYPNSEDVVIVKQPKEGVVYTPKSKDNVCTFQIVTIKMKCNIGSFGHIWISSKGHFTLYTAKLVHFIFET